MTARERVVQRIALKISTRVAHRSARRAVLVAVATTLAVAPMTALAAGAQWQVRGTFPLVQHHFVDLACPSTTQCVAVGSPTGGLTGEAERSLDGGATWQSASLPSVPPLRRVSCPTTSDCVAIGGGPVGAHTRVDLLESSDGGADWSSRSKGPSRSRRCRVAPPRRASRS